MKDTRFCNPHLFRKCLVIFLFCLGAAAFTFAAEAPRFVQKDGRWALLVDGQPYLMLGGQLHNSSAWPSELPRVFKAIADPSPQKIA